MDSDSAYGSSDAPTMEDREAAISSPTTTKQQRVRSVPITRLSLDFGEPLGVPSAAAAAADDDADADGADADGGPPPSLLLQQQLQRLQAEHDAMRARLEDSERLRDEKAAQLSALQRRHAELAHQQQQQQAAEGSGGLVRVASGMSLAAAAAAAAQQRRSSGGGGGTPG
jgi:hypothetical protein